MSQRKIAKEVGCSTMTVNNIKKAIDASVQNDQVSQNVHSEPTQEDQDLDDLIGTEEELDQEEKEAEESAARFQAQLEQDEAKRRKSASNVTTSGSKSTEDDKGVSPFDDPTSDSVVENEFTALMEALIEITTDKKKYTVAETELVSAFINSAGY